MSTNSYQDIEKLESDLWSAADNLRANSKLTSSDYFMPVLGIIFLRHASNRFEVARKLIEPARSSSRRVRIFSPGFRSWGRRCSRGRRTHGRVAR
jgi:type I restriction enzyme M protein